MLIAKYKFNRNVNSNALPNFKSGYEYTVEDTQYDSQYTIRSIFSDSPPTSISFNNSSMMMSCVHVEYLDVSQIVNMRSMFRNCFELTRIDSGDWDTSKVKDMSFMFDSCSRLNQLDTSKWDTTNVVNMSFMFYYCSELTQLDASSWNTSKVKNMQSMFDQCYKLYRLDISNWDTSNVTIKNQMFSNCGRLTQIGMVYCSLNTINTLLDISGTSLPTGRAKKVYVHDVSSSECPTVNSITFIDYIGDREIIKLPRTLLNGDQILWDASRRYIIKCSDGTIIETDITSKFKIDLYTPYTMIYADNATSISVNISRKEI